MPSELATKAIDLLTPTIGEFLAKAKVQAACNMSNTNIETLDKQQLNAFLEKFERICAMDLGDNMASSISGRLRQ